MQQQIAHSEHLVLPAPVDLVPGQPVRVRDCVGVAMDAVSAGERVVLYLRGVFVTGAVSPNDVWFAGQALYWNDEAEVFQTGVTDWRVGAAAADKGAGVAVGKVNLMHTIREATANVGSLFIGQEQVAEGATGTFLVKSWPEFHRVLRVTWSIAGTLVGDASTRISIGTGTGTNEQIMLDTDLATLNAAGFDEISVTPPEITRGVYVSIKNAGLTEGALAFIVEAILAPGGGP